MTSLFIELRERSVHKIGREGVSMKTFLVPALLTAILLVVGTGVYSYRQELIRQAQVRCEEASRENPSVDPVDVRQKCYGIQPTAEQLAVRDKQRREDDCREALDQYGPQSEVSKQHCANTELGKKIDW